MAAQLGEQLPERLRRGRGLGIVHETIEFFQFARIFGWFHGARSCPDVSRHGELVISVKEL